MVCVLNFSPRINNIAKFSELLKMQKSIEMVANEPQNKAPVTWNQKSIEMVDNEPQNETPVTWNQSPPESPTSSRLPSLTQKTKGCNAKSPITALIEMCVKQRVQPPVFECVYRPIDHTKMPVFEIHLKVYDIETQASGYSKRSAKHDASVLMLRILKKKGYKIEADMRILSPLTTKGPKEENEPEISSEALNPIGSLQEISSANSWPLPVYALEEATEVARDNTFRISCSVENHFQVGSGKTKKIAKRSAAQLVLQMIKDSTVASGTQ